MTDSDESIASRIARFRKIAEETKVAAREAATPEAKQTYENLVLCWEQLIFEAEQLAASEKRS